MSYLMRKRRRNKKNKKITVGEIFQQQRELEEKMERDRLDRYHKWINDFIRNDPEIKKIMKGWEDDYEIIWENPKLAVAKTIDKDCPVRTILFPIIEEETGAAGENFGERPKENSHRLRGNQEGVSLS